MGVNKVKHKQLFLIDSDVSKETVSSCNIQERMRSRQTLLRKGKECREHLSYSPKLRDTFQSLCYPRETRDLGNGSFLGCRLRCMSYDDGRGDKGKRMLQLIRSS